MKLKRYIPRPIKSAIFAIGGRLAPSSLKYTSELDYWRDKWEDEKHFFKNDHYEHLMLSMAGETDQNFLKGKIVADFGCGPRGSLIWAKVAKMRIGVDILADRYTQFNISSHDMTYVCSTEKKIPLPSNYVDILFTMNAMDHVSNFKSMCKEIVRVLAPGGELIGSFNLDELPTFAEPYVLTEELLEANLLKIFKVSSYRTAAKGPPEDAYKNFFSQSPALTKGPRILWVRANKQ